MNPATSPSSTGRLFLVPAPLDFGCESQQDLRTVLPDGTLRQAAQITHWVCENAKTTRAYLKRIDALFPLAQPLQAQQLTELPREAHKKGDHGTRESAQFDASKLLTPALQGHDMGLISEAGMPAIADPGSAVVRAAHALGLTVVPLVGPVSLLLALAASGLNGQNFAFVGYLPQDAGERAKRLQTLEKLAHQTGQTQLFIETPYRNAALQEAMLLHLQPRTRMLTASGLTLDEAQIRTATVQQWRQARWPAPDKHQPTVFGLGV